MTGASLRLGIQEIIAPLDRLLQGLLAGRDIADAALKQMLSLLQASEQRVRRKELDAGGCQFECQGQPIQAYAYLGNNGSVLMRQLKIGMDFLSPLAEEGHRARTGKYSTCGKLLRIRQGQWRDGKCVFAPQMQHGPAGHQKLQRGASEEQC